ncbi:nuclease, partial [Enterococcus faecalis]|nr:nuclease [Enterococcus faecalis]
PILLKKDFVAKAGDSFTGRIAGPVWYSYTNYKVLVDNASLPTFNDGGLVPEKTNIIKKDQKLSIASYNIENFSANKESTSDEKVTRIARSFVNDLNSPDIIGLIEVQDNNGAIDDGITDASLSAQRLIDAITSLGGPQYTYLDIAPENNADGGAPGGNIRVGFLYNPNRVQLSQKPVGGPTDAVSWSKDGLSHSLGRIDPTNPAWDSVRKSL